MKKERSNTQKILIDIQYHESMNFFEYQYGDFISYKQMEQRSYIDFKEIMFHHICREIKFRKYGRLGKILTIKAEMLNSEIEKFRKILESDQLEIGTGWIISNVTLIKETSVSEKISKYKKIKNESENDDLEEDDDLVEEEEEDFEEF